MKIKLAFLGFICICLFHIANAQDSTVKAISADVAQANNPLAKFTALNVHYYYIGELTELNTNAHQAWLAFRYAIFSWEIKMAFTCFTSFQLFSGSTRP